MREELWRCSECDLIYWEEQLLKAFSPFDKNDVLIGCPNCKSVDSFTQVCDALSCRKEATCGISTKEKYRRVCGDHYRELDQQKELEKK